MRSSMGEQLKRAAAVPTRPLDYQHARRRGLIQRATALVLVAIGVTGVVALSMTAYPHVFDAFESDRASAPVGDPCDQNVASIRVFLSDDVHPTELRVIEDVLQDREGIATVEYVSKNEAFEEYRNEHIDKPKFWSHLAKDALPASFQVQLEAGAPVDALERVLDGLRGVDEARSSSSARELSCEPDVEAVGACAPAPLAYLHTTVAPPKDGAAVDHYGVWVRVGVGFHEAGCFPTVYMELDGKPVIATSAGLEHGEFSSASSASEACVRAESVEGNFLYSGKHVVGIGTGCDPESSGPFMTQRHFRFDGNAHSLIASDDPSAFCDQARYLDELREPPTDEELQRLGDAAPTEIRDEATLLVESSKAHREGDELPSQTDELQAATDRFDEYVAAECRVSGVGRT